MVGLRHATAVRTLAEAALAPSSQRAYQSTWQHLRIFLHRPDGVSLVPLSAIETADFLGARFDSGCCGATLASTASAIAYAHKMHGLPDPTADFRIRQLLAGARKLRPRQDRRLALSIQELSQLCDATPYVTTSPVEQAAYRAIFCLAFFLMLRPGEVVKGRYL